MNVQEVFEQYRMDNDGMFEDELQFGRFTAPGLDTYKYMELYPEITEPPEEIIEGLLRRGRKMLLSGPSKSAKSCLLLELAVAITEGRSWLGFPCRKSKVLYVNLELDACTVFQRLKRIYLELGIDTGEKEDFNANAHNLHIWNLRGYPCTIAVLAMPLAYICQEEEIDAVIIDPIYKVLNADENNAGEIGRICSILDRIAKEGNCSVIFSHHHSKGAKGNRQVLDRSSGSGVFARDPDAILDLIQLEPSAATMERLGDGMATAWRMEAVLREFPPVGPVNCWFRFPIHTLDTEGLLNETAAAGSAQANLCKSSKRVSREDRQAAFNKAFEALSENGRPVKITDMAKMMKVTQQTVRNRFEELQDQYWMENRMIGKLAQSA